jgi:L,D-peptidoglycan transpeptidase YkuD (ErfK/YbiS/YcfS/YnhG family)
MATSHPPRVFTVRALSASATSGWISCGAARFKCALGRCGRRAIKREGDGASPIGRWPLRRVFYRADRMTRPRTGLLLAPLRRDDGWCDAAADRNYNRRVRLPYSASAESMWRQDRLYDLVVVLGHNDRPRRRNGGSAIFLHLARPGYAPTAGCIALARSDALRLLALMRRGDAISIPH